MSKVSYSIANGKTNDKVYIRCSTSTFDELGLGSTQTGFIEVQPDKADALLEMFENGELGVEFGVQNNLGLYEIKPIKASSLVHA